MSERQCETTLLDHVKRVHLKLRDIRSDHLNHQQNDFRAMQIIEDAIDDSAVTSQMFINFDRLESELSRLRLQTDGLSNENRWLREELKRVRQQFQESECKKASLEVRIEDLKYRLELLSVGDETSINDTTIVPSTQNENSLRLSDSGCLTGQESISLKSDDLSKLCELPMDSKDLPRRFKNLKSLIYFYVGQKQSEVALLLAKQLVTDLENNYGPNHIEIATMLNLLAQLYKDRRRYKEAIQALQRALKIRESVCGTDNVSIAAILNNLSVLYGKRDDYREAERLCARALQIREEIFGKGHSEVAKLYFNLGLIRSHLGKLKDAEVCYRRAIDIYTRR